MYSSGHKKKKKKKEKTQEVLRMNVNVRNRKNNPIDRNMQRRVTLFLWHRYGAVELISTPYIRTKQAFR